MCSFTPTVFVYISGMIFGVTWRQSRKFALHSMRDFGLGKHSIDERIQDEAAVLVEQFRSKNGQPFDPEIHIIKAVSNIICSITFGKRLVVWQGIKFIFNINPICIASYTSVLDFL